MEYMDPRREGDGGRDIIGRGKPMEVATKKPGKRLRHK